MRKVLRARVVCCWLWELVVGVMKKEVRGIVIRKMDAMVEDEEMGIAIKKTQRSRWGHWDRYG
jgi:hypothetical protein